MLCVQAAAAAETPSDPAYEPAARLLAETFDGAGLNAVRLDGRPLVTEPLLVAQETLPPATIDTSPLPPPGTGADTTKKTTTQTTTEPPPAPRKQSHRDTGTTIIVIVLSVVALGVLVAAASGDDDEPAPAPAGTGGSN